MSKYLIINIDKISIFFIPNEQNNIYKIKKAKQVFIYRKKEIITFTAILFINLKGEVVATQYIWKKVFVINLRVFFTSKETIKKKYYLLLIDKYIRVALK